MRYEVNGIYSRTGANVYLGSFSTIKKAEKFIKSEVNTNIYKVVAITEKVKKGHSAYSYQFYYYDPLNDTDKPYSPWISVSGEYVRYDICMPKRKGVADIINNGEDGRHYWEVYMKNSSVMNRLFEY
jgi:hypothetical protein